jgi:hypothetical protein
MRTKFTGEPSASNTKLFAKSPPLWRNTLFVALTSALTISICLPKMCITSESETLASDTKNSGLYIDGDLKEAIPQIYGTLPVTCSSATAPNSFFPFVIPSIDRIPSQVDMSFLNSEPAGSLGYSRIVNGHFVDGNGQRLRLLGTNLICSAAFPKKEIANKIAAQHQWVGDQYR